MRMYNIDPLEIRLPFVWFSMNVISLNWKYSYQLLEIFHSIKPSVYSGLNIFVWLICEDILIASLKYCFMIAFCIVKYIYNIYSMRENWKTHILVSFIHNIVFSTAQAGARGRDGCCTYSLSLMYRLNQTESAILL
jgi:hypothetical protein